MFFFFFFQAEDGIRDLTVTGVQTCALPICFFSAAAIGEFRVVEGADGFNSDGDSRRTGCSTGFDGSAGCAGVVAADDEESGRWPRILGSARTATMTRNAAIRGTT